MKNSRNLSEFRHRLTLKAGLKMKLSLILVIGLFFQMQAETSFSQEKRISLNLQSATILQVIEPIEANSDYRFFYSREELDLHRKISLSVRKAKIERILQEIFLRSNIQYKIFDRQIVLTRKPPERIKQIIINRLDRLPGLNFSVGKLSYPILTVTGVVTNQDEEPLIGVNIQIKGTTRGTSTDNEGRYEIVNVDENAVLVVSYIGYQKMEVVVDGRVEIDIQMVEDVATLEELVVTGYGTVRRNEFVGATSVVTAEELSQIPITSIEQGFKGKLPGVQVVQSSGAPGSGISVRVRGITSIAGGNQPLFVIDGIPVFNDDVRGLNGISSLNPNDIASIVVLKDASSTAIYGSRAANGVIQITTKDGKAGRSRMSYNGYVGFQTVRNQLNLMSGSEFISFATDYFNNSADISNDERASLLAELSEVGNENTNWQDQVYRTGIQQSHNLSFSSGDANNSYYVSANYSNQEGVIKETDFERVSLRANLKNNLSEKISIDTRLSLSQSSQNGYLPSDGSNTRNFGKSGIGSMLLALPTVAPFDSEGNFSNVSPYSFTDADVENPVAFLTATDHHRLNRVQGIIGLTYQITDNLRNIVRAAVDYTDRKSDFYSPKALIQLGSQVATLQTTRYTNTLIEDYLNYKNTFNQFDIDVVLGASTQSEQFNSIYLAGTGFPSDELRNNAIQAASTSAIPQTYSTDQKLVSIFGRVQFDYGNKYLLSINARKDGSSVFSEDNKYASFGAIGGAWNMSEENFMKGGFFSNLKLRVSTGSTGNQAIEPYQSLYLGSIVLTGQGAGTGLNVGIAPNLPNPHLTWETTNQTNLGMDIGIKNDKYRLYVDYYIKNTQDLLATVNLPQSSGFSTIVDNIGKVRNKGLEFFLSLDLIDKPDLYFSVDAMLSKNTNVVLETNQGLDIIFESEGSRSSNIARKGESLFSFYMPKYIGMDQNGEIYEDLNDDEEIDGDDFQIVGTALPDFFYGFNLNFQYKKATLVFNWQGVSGVSVNNVGQYLLTDPEPTLNRIANLADYYPNPNSALSRRQSSRFIEDASYLRLANVRLSYDLAGSGFLDLNHVNLYISAQNLITITDYSGFDPEVNSFGGNEQFLGVDLAAYPSARTITLGLNLTF